jgi:hypothetical protein
MMISGVVYSLGDWIAQVLSHFNFQIHATSLPLLASHMSGHVAAFSVITDYWLPLFLLLLLLLLQCYEGKPIFDFDRARMFRSGLVGFTLHGSLSHYYYHICEVTIVTWPAQIFFACTF